MKVPTKILYCPVCKRKMLVRSKLIRSFKGINHGVMNYNRITCSRKCSKTFQRYITPRLRYNLERTPFLVKKIEEIINKKFSILT